MGAAKAAQNLAKHRISQRFVTFGVSSRGRLLVVAHANRDDIIRILSARIGTRTERKIYDER